MHILNALAMANWPTVNFQSNQPNYCQPRCRDQTSLSLSYRPKVCRNRAFILRIHFFFNAANLMKLGSHFNRIDGTNIKEII